MWLQLLKYSLRYHDNYRQHNHEVQKTQNFTICRNMPEKKRSLQYHAKPDENRCAIKWLTYLATPSCWLTDAARTTCKYLNILTIDSMTVL